MDYFDDTLKTNILLSLIGISMNTTMPIINRIELYYHIHQLDTRFDKKIPVKVYFVIPYLAYFPYLFGGWTYLGLSKSDNFMEFVFSMGVMGLITGLVNLIFPTRAPRAYIYGKNVFSRLIKWHYSLNRPLTAFPSLHVAHAICLTIFFVMEVPELTAFWIALPVLIALSTLFTKEHYVLDVVGGIVLGLAVPVVFLAL